MFWGLGLAHVVCCGGFILVVTGAAGGLGGWFLDGGTAWLALAIAIAAAGLLLWMWRRRRGRRADAESQSRGARAP